MLTPGKPAAVGKKKGIKPSNLKAKSPTKSPSPKKVLQVVQFKEDKTDDDIS